MSTKYLMRLVIGICAAAMIAAFGCSRDTNAIRLGYLQNDLHHLPAFIALEKGFYENEGLEVSIGGIFRAGPEEMSAFAAGELDAGYVGLAPAATAALNGVADIIILAQVNVEGSAIVCSPDIASLAQLRDKTVAIPGHATMQDSLLQKGLRSQGLTPRMLRLIVLKPPEMLPALTSGTIDCFIAWEPYPAQALSSGAGKMVARSSALWKDHPCCVLIASDHFARENPEKTSKLIRAHRQACRFIAEHPEDALNIAVQYTGMPRETIRKAMEHIGYAPDIDRKKTSSFTDFLSDLHYLAPKIANERNLEFFNEH